MLLASLPGGRSYRLLLLLLPLLLLLLLLLQHYNLSPIMNSSRVAGKNVSEDEYKEILDMDMVRSIDR